MQMKTGLITALCTPLNDDGSLHVEGLAAHIEDQWSHGIAGVLVGGTMGLMQLLDDETYHELVRQSVKLSKGRGEVMIGVGDTSFTRTLSRIRFVEQFDVDAIVVLAPYFFQLNQAELLAYFSGLADQSKKPIYMYDLPGRTKTTLELDTVLQLANHPNIHGIKCSGEYTGTRRLMDHVGDKFRVVPAQPLIVDMLVRCGVRENLDGIFGILPGLSVGIAEAAEKGDYALAAARQADLTEFLHLIVGKYPLFPACTVVLNARGIPGRVHPVPMKTLDSAQAANLLEEPLIQKLLAADSLDAR
jgi:4-hydroxy-tetrahydrodipicolinate synthase